MDLQSRASFRRGLDKEKGVDLDLFRNFTYLMAELGETVRAAHKFERARGVAEEDEARDHFGEQLADCLARVLRLASCAGVDLQACYTRKMKQNLERTWRKKSNNTDCR